MAVAKHGHQHMPKMGPDSIYYAVWHIALSGDRDADDPVVTEDGVFRPPIVADMDQLYLKELMLGLGVESSSGDVSVMIRNDTQAVDLLASDASIPAGDRYAECTAAISTDPADTLVNEGDILVFDITDGGSDAKGLKAILVFRL